MLENWERLGHLPGAQVLKSNLSRTVIALPSTSSRPALIIKQYHVRGMSERLKYLFLLSRAANEWTALQHLKNAEVAVPRPLRTSVPFEHLGSEVWRRPGMSERPWGPW